MTVLPFAGVSPSAGIIMPGVVLGDRTIVGANAVVTRSFPEGDQVLAGVPARVVNRSPKRRPVA